MSDNDKDIKKLFDPLEESVEKEKQQKLLEKFDKEYSIEKERNDWVNKVVGIMGGLLAVYITYTAAFGAPEAFLHRSIFVLVCFTMVFLIFPARKKDKGKPPKWIDYLFIAATLFFSGYIILERHSIMMRGAMATEFEMILFVIAVIVTLEAVRRVSNLGMVIIISVFLLYAYLGQYLPGVLAHPGLSHRRMASHLLLTSEGLFGFVIAVVAGIIGLFVIFATFMEKTGVGKFINDFALSIAGHTTGGPAKVSVITSALFGTISGNATSNVVTTGAFTIPLMKRTGYSKEFAGAVEAASSTAGQLMPPIMGAAAFLMADVTGIPYAKIAMAAIVPVLLFYVGVFNMIHIRAKKLGLQPMPKDRLPIMKEVLIHQGYLFIPFIFVVVMLMLGYTVTYVGFWSIVVSVVVAAFKKESRLSIVNIWEVFMLSGKRLLSIGAICAGISLIIGVVSVTGISQTLSSMIIQLASGNFVLTLILIALVCIIMGMGLPSASVYLLLAVVAAPALVIGFDVPVLAAHFFVFYFGIMANVTPPVAIPAYAAAGLADADPAKTGWQAFKLALAGFIVPFLFISAPDLLFIDFSLATVPKIITAIMGVYMMGHVLEGFMFTKMPALVRVILIFGALCMVFPETITDIVGGVILIVCMIWMKKMEKRSSRTEAIGYDIKS